MKPWNVGWFGGGVEMVWGGLELLREWCGVEQGGDCDSYWCELGNTRTTLKILKERNIEVYHIKFPKAKSKYLAYIQAEHDSMQ